MGIFVRNEEVFGGDFTFSTLTQVQTAITNGLIPDGTTVFVGDENGGKIYKYLDGELVPFGGGAEIPYFATQELADAAILAGDLKEGDYYAVGNDSLYDMEYDAENELLVVSDDLVDYDAETETLEIEV